MRRPGALTLLVLILAGCAGDGAPSAPTRSSRVEPARDHADTRRADPAAVRVIRAWVSAERLSEPRQAASLFAVPAVVYNGGKPLLLEDRVAVREFNETLPCGAVLLRAAKPARLDRRPLPADRAPRRLVRQRGADGEHRLRGRRRPDRRVDPRQRPAPGGAGAARVLAARDAAPG